MAHIIASIIYEKFRYESSVTYQECLDLANKIIDASNKVVIDKHEKEIR